MGTETQAVSRYVTINGLKIHYVDWGNAGAPPMVLLHGLRAYGHWFDEFAEVVKDRYQVLALDQRGRGESDWAKDGDYTREAYVSDLEAFVDALKLDKFVLVGHSMGGLNAIHYTACHPDRVIALLDLDIGPEVDPAGMQRIRTELGKTPEEFDSWEQAKAFLRERHPKAAAENIQTRLRWMLKESPEGKVVWRLDKAIFDPNLRLEPSEQTWSLLKQIRCPTLIVCGSESDVLSAETCEKMVKLIPGSRWVEIPNAGHMIIEDNPVAFNAAALDFLQSSAPAQAA